MRRAHGLSGHVLGDLSSLFHDEATAPLRAASRFASKDRLGDAIAAIDRDVLMEHLRMGVERVARACGRPSLGVFRRLPMEELDEHLEKLALHQAQAMEQWHRYKAGGGAIPSVGVAKTTEDLPPMLRARAAALADDLALASSLAHLADEVVAWKAELATCQSRIDAARDLRRAWRIRRAARGGLVLLLLFGVGGLGGWGGLRLRARARLDDIVARGACEVEAVPAEDLELATPVQRQAIAAERRRCDEEREAQRRAEQERAAAEAKRREEEREVAARRQACAELGRAFGEGTIDEVDAALVGDGRELLERIANSKLTLDDIGEDFELPCADTEAGRAIGLAYAQAMLKSIPQWIQITVPSASARALLIEHREDLPPNELAILAGHIDNMAKRAVLTGLEDDVRHFEVLCGLAVQVVQPPMSNCQAVMKLAAEL